MSEVREICEQLDRSTDNIMNTLQQILHLQTELEANMRNGFLLMSKARYNIGMTRISALQYKEGDLEEAITKVKVTQDDHQSTASFSIWTDESDQDHVHSSSLRQRKERKKDDAVDDLTDEIQDIGINRESHKDHGDCDDQEDSKHYKSKCDPLNWFGVLVPQALRQSQGMFQRATDQCCHLASLKAQLLQLRLEHGRLMQRKNELRPVVSTDDYNVHNDSAITDSTAL